MTPNQRYVCPVCGKASTHPLDAMYGHCAACGANRIQTGVYEVGGTLHVIIPDLLRANGWPATPENVDLVARTAYELWGEATVLEDRPRPGLAP